MKTCRVALNSSGVGLPVDVTRFPGSKVGHCATTSSPPGLRDTATVRRGGCKAIPGGIPRRPRMVEQWAADKRPARACPAVATILTSPASEQAQVERARRRGRQSRPPESGHVFLGGAKVGPTLLACLRATPSGPSSSAQCDRYPSALDCQERP
jgi:hypothetical protein